MTTVSIQTIVKAPGDKFTITFDYTKLLEAGEKITSPATVTVVPFFGVDESPQNVLDGSAQIPVDGLGVLQKVKGGLAGFLYRLACTANTDAGNTFVVYCMLEVDG